MELFTMSIPEPSLVEAFATRAEEEAWDGITFTDSQNLCGDPFVAIGVAGRVTDRLKFMTGVTNAATRHPAALATAAATAHEFTNGRLTLGIGRGDTALFHLGRTPMPVAEFVARTTELHTYLQRGTVDMNGFPSRIRWLDRAQQAPVPVDVAASGPKIIGFAARTVDRITFAVGADPERLAWAIEIARSAMADAGRTGDEVAFASYVTVGCHPDRAAARDLVRGGVAAFAHFSAMPGSTGDGLADADRESVAAVGRAYNSHEHLVNSAAHAHLLPDEFVDRFAVVGDAAHCIDRLRELASLGLDRLVVNGPSFGADREDAARHRRLLVDEVLPALR